MIPRGKAALSHEHQVIPEATSAGSNPYTRKQTAAPFMNIKDIWPNPNRQDMARPTEPGLRFLKRRVSLKVKAMGATRAVLARKEGMIGVSTSPEKASDMVLLR